VGSYPGKPGPANRSKVGGDKDEIVESLFGDETRRWHESHGDSGCWWLAPCRALD
jgi:hypothetical protein